MADQTIEIEVLRYSPETDDEPHFQTYTIPYRLDWSILDALNHIKDQLDATLSFRWSCHMAVCGSCGMMVDKVPHLSCKTFLRDYYPNKISVEPLANFAIERDLVVDIEPFLKSLASIKPYLIHELSDPDNKEEYLETPAELIKFKQYSMCINCLLCYSACPEFALDPEFSGPAALSLAHRYNADVRDQGKDERMRVINTEKGIWPCMFVGACSEVCPKGVDPAAALQQLKVASVFDFYKSLIASDRK